MADVGMTWDYCEKCGRRIVVGEICYDTGNDSYCSDCCKTVDTKNAWGDRFDAAVEYVPVVRCRDCKHIDKVTFVCTELDTEVGANHYCSFGERKADNAAD